VRLSTYAHLIEEYTERDRVDPEREIADARGRDVRPECVHAPARRL